MFDFFNKRKKQNMVLDTVVNKKNVSKHLFFVRKDVWKH